MTIKEALSLYMYYARYANKSRVVLLHKRLSRSPKAMTWDGYWDTFRKWRNVIDAKAAVAETMRNAIESN